MSSNTPELHPGNAVIASLYSAVLDSANLTALFEAWDGFVDHVFEQDPDEAARWQSLLSEHFDQVSPLIIVSKPSLAEEKQAFVDRQTFPALLFNERFRIVAQNAQAETLWPAAHDEDLSEKALPPFNAKRILNLRKSLDHPDPVLISLDMGTEAQSRIAMAVIHPVEFTAGDGQSREVLFILRIAMPSWKEELDRMLASTYALTESEIEIVRALYQNQNLKTIAEDRERSIRTVRTQLSRVFEKTGASSQTELIAMISNLGQIVDMGGAEKPDVGGLVARSSVSADVDLRLCQTPEGHNISYAVYGDPDGKPILSIQPTVPPAATERFRQAMGEAGLKMIVPHKPGSGQSSSRNYRYTSDHMARDMKHVLTCAGLETATILGISSGGVHALEFARTYPEAVQACILAETGVPLRSHADFRKMSPNPRRTFLPARYFPKILMTAHKMVAKTFHESEAGQRQVIDYFYESSPPDQTLVSSGSEFHDLTRNIIRYSFEDIRQLVDNVCLWASDWSDVLGDALSACPVHFVHGERNDVFMWEAVAAFCQAQSGASATMLGDRGQLGIFAEPEVLAACLARD